MAKKVSIWRRLRLRVIAYLSRGLDEVPQPISRTMTYEAFKEKCHHPGLDCPRCGTLITVDIPMLLSGLPICCPHCSLAIRVNQEKSEDSLRVLGRVLAKVEKARKMVEEAKTFKR